LSRLASNGSADGRDSLGYCLNWIQAPSFITAGDRIVIETADNSYVTRSVAGHFVSEASPAFPVFLFAIVVFLLTQLLSLHRILIP
jgi:hypothetical protein